MHLEDQYDIFISYAREDEEEGVSCWRPLSKSSAWKVFWDRKLPSPGDKFP